jgi:hypothetical protein
MKTIITILLSILLFASCKTQPKGLYEVTYIVFYPQHADTVTVELESNDPWNVHCKGGDNYMWSPSGGYYLSTSAPIKIIHQYQVK